MRLSRLSVVYLVSLVFLCSGSSLVLSQPWLGGGGLPKPAPAAPSAVNPAQAHLAKGMQYLNKRQLAQAIAEFKEVIRLAPGNPIGYGQLATAYLMKGDTASAESPLLKVVQLDPKNFQARMMLVDIYLQSRRFSQSISAAKEAARLKPKDARPHFAMGVAYLMQKNNSAAIASFRRTIQLDPKHIGAMHNLAMIYGEAKNYTAARQVLAKAAAVAPNDDGILSMQAGLEMQVDKKTGPQKAIALYKKALARNPRRAAACFGLAAVYDQTGQQQNALTYYKKVIALAPNHVPSLLNAARLYLADRTSKNAAEGHRKASEYLKKVVKLAPESSMGWSMLGLAQLYLDDNAAAEKSLKRALSIDAKDVQALEGLAFLYEKGEKLKDAVQVVETLAEMREDDVDTQLRLARLYDRAKDENKALSKYQAIVTKFPKNTDAMAERARALNSHGHRDKAAEQYRAILTLKPNDMNTQMWIAYLYCWDEDRAVRDKAIPELEAAKKMAEAAKPPTDPKQPDERMTPFRTLAGVYDKDGDTAKAAEEYNQALKLNPNDTGMRRGLAGLYEKDPATMDKAVEEYRKMIDLNPDDELGYTLLGRAIEKKTQKAEDVVAEYRAYIAAKPEALAPRYVLADRFAKLEDEASQNAAIAEYEGILKIKAEETRAMFGAAGVYEKQKKLDLSLEQMKKALDKNPDDARVLEMTQRLVAAKNDPQTTLDWLARLRSMAAQKGSESGALYGALVQEHLKAGKGPEAEAVLQDALKKDPKNIQAMLALGGYYDGAGQKEKAISTYKKALDADKQNAQACKGIGNVYFGLRKYAEALKWFREWSGGKQMFFFPVDEAQIRTAQCLEYLGKKDEALKEYEKLAAGDPKNEEIKAGINRLKPAPAPPPYIPTELGPGAGF